MRAASGSGNTSKKTMRRRNEKWKSLPEAKNYLKEGMSFARLDAMAKTMSDTEWARKMRAARVALLRRCKSESPDARETA